MKHLIPEHIEVEYIPIDKELTALKHKHQFLTSPPIRESVELNDETNIISHVIQRCVMFETNPWMEDAY